MYKLKAGSLEGEKRQGQGRTGGRTELLYFNGRYLGVYSAWHREDTCESYLRNKEIFNIEDCQREFF